MFTHKFEKRVRYSETDRMGYMYYGNYPAYFEVGRVEALRSLGLSYKKMEDDGIIMPVMALNIRYVRPALYDDLLTIKTEIRVLPDKNITFHSDIFNEKNKLVNGGSVKLCFVDVKTNKTVNIPDSMLTKLMPYFER